MEIAASFLSSRLGSSADASVAAAPSSAATQQFAALMQAPAPQSIAADVAPAVASTRAVSAAGPASVGEKILNGLQGASNEIHDSWNKVSDMLRPSVELGLREMVDLQRHTALMSVQMELMSKGVSSAIQTIEKTVRVQ